MQNKKVELIFLQVKKQIKTENLDISSGSILPLLEVLRGNNQLVDSESFVEEDDASKVLESVADSKTVAAENLSASDQRGQ